MRRHERFARLLDAGHQPAGAGELGPLLRVAHSLGAAGRSHRPAPLGEQLRARQRQRLIAVATVRAAAIEPGGQRSARPGRLSPRLAALGCSVAVVTAVAGVGVAGARSLPGQPFYDVKRAAESVQLWLAHGDLAKGRRQLEFARTRLAEARALPPSDRTRVGSTLASMDDETRAGSRDLVAAYRSTRSPQPLIDLATFARQQYVGLVALARRISPARQPHELSSLQLLGTVTELVRQTSGGCLRCLLGGSPAPAPQHSPTGTQSPRPGPMVTPSATPPGHHRHGPNGSPTGSPSPTRHQLLPSLPALPSLPPLPSLLPLPLPLPSLLPSHHARHHAPPSPGSLLHSLLPSLVGSLPI